MGKMTRRRHRVPPAVHRVARSKDARRQRRRACGVEKKAKSDRAGARARVECVLREQHDPVRKSGERALVVEEERGASHLIWRARAEKKYNVPVSSIAQLSIIRIPPNHEYRTFGEITNAVITGLKWKRNWRSIFVPEKATLEQTYTHEGLSTMTPSQ